MVFFAEERLSVLDCWKLRTSKEENSSLEGWMKQEFDSGSLFLKVCRRTKQGGHKQGGRSRKSKQGGSFYWVFLQSVFFARVCCGGLFTLPIQVKMMEHYKNNVFLLILILILICARVCVFPLVWKLLDVLLVENIL